MAIPAEALQRLLGYAGGGIGGMDGRGIPDLTAANLKVTDYGPGPGVPNPTAADKQEFTGIHDIPLGQGSAALQPGTARKFGLHPGDPFTYGGRRFYYHDRPADPAAGVGTRNVGNVLDIYNPSDMGPSWGWRDAPLSQPTGGTTNVGVDPTGANIDYAPGAYTGELGGPGDPGGNIYDPDYGAGLKSYQGGGVADPRLPPSHALQEFIIRRGLPSEWRPTGRGHQFDPGAIPMFNARLADPDNQQTIIPAGQKYYDPYASAYPMMAQEGGVAGDDYVNRLTPQQAAALHRQLMNAMQRYQMPQGATRPPQMTPAMMDRAMQTVNQYGLPRGPIYTADMLTRPPPHASGYFGELDTGGQIRPQVEKEPPDVSAQALQMLRGGGEQDESEYAAGGVVNTQLPKPTKAPKVPKPPKAPKPPKLPKQDSGVGFQFGPPGRYQQPQPKEDSQGTIPREFMNYLAKGGIIKDFGADHMLMFALGQKYPMAGNKARER